MKPAVLTTALTGPLATKADNPALPTTPEEIAAAAKDAYAGMEDTLMLRRGQPTTGNGELTERLATTATALDRPPATVEQTIDTLQLGHSVSEIRQAA
jgi:uncharacterized protein (DUF849 family)